MPSRADGGPPGAGGLPVTTSVLTQSKNASGRAGRTSTAARTARRALAIKMTRNKIRVLTPMTANRKVYTNPQID